MSDIDKLHTDITNCEVYFKSDKNKWKSCVHRSANCETKGEVKNERVKISFFVIATWFLTWKVLDYSINKTTEFMEKNKDKIMNIIKK